MAEVALAGTIIGLVGAGAKLSLNLFDFASTIGSAGSDIQIIGKEISLFCSVLSQVQKTMLSEDVHYSSAAIKTLKEIIEECDDIFGSIDTILDSLCKAEGPGLFPSVDFIGRVKWTFKKSRVQVLRSTLESCKLTLNIMLQTMDVAQKLSARGHTTLDHNTEDNRDDLVTQSLIISQQCAIDQLSAIEDEDEGNAPLYKRLGGRPDSRLIGTESEHTRMSRLLNGLSLRTGSAKIPVRTKRASLWLSDMVLGEGDPQAPHPGLQRKRFSSTKVEGRPQQLLRKWTDLAEANGINGRVTHTQAASGADTATPNTWIDDTFTFSAPATPGSSISPTRKITMQPRLARQTTDLVSPRSSKVVNNVNHEFSQISRQTTFVPEPVTLPIKKVTTAVVGSLQAVAGSETISVLAATDATLAAFEATLDSQSCSLWVSYGGHRRIVESCEDPGTLLRQLNAMGLSPCLMLSKA